MTDKEANKVLEELYEVRPEKLNDKAKRLFEGIMSIADKKNRAIADLYEANNRIVDYMDIIEERDRLIDLMIEHIYTGCDFDNNIKTKEQIREYFEERCK